MQESCLCVNTKVLMGLKIRLGRSHTSETYRRGKGAKMSLHVIKVSHSLVNNMATLTICVMITWW